MDSLRLRQNSPAYLHQLHLAYRNPTKQNLAGPWASQAPLEQAGDGLRKGTVAGSLVELVCSEEGNFCSSLLGQEQQRKAEDLRGLLLHPNSGREAFTSPCGGPLL